VNDVETGEDNSSAREAAGCRPAQGSPIDVSEPLVAPSRCSLLDRSKQQVGADGKPKPDININIGVVSEPVPTPVIPITNRSHTPQQ
jgi:hypothetical protein